MSHPEGPYAARVSLPSLCCTLLAVRMLASFLLTALDTPQQGNLSLSAITLNLLTLITPDLDGPGNTVTVLRLLLCVLHKPLLLCPVLVPYLCELIRSGIEVGLVVGWKGLVGGCMGEGGVAQALALSSFIL